MSDIRIVQPSPLIWRQWLPVIAIFALTTICYLPIARAGFIWDDGKHVTQNGLLHSVDGLITLWTERTALPQYYPLTHTLFWIEYHLWGNDPTGFHLVNLLVHSCNAVLIWRILRRLNIGGALLAALVFAVHPMHVETVGWVSEGKNTLSAFFYLLSLLCHLRLQPLADEGQDGWIWYFAAFGLFCCALLSKTVTSTLPAVMLLLIWWKNGRLRWKNVRPLLPFFVVGMIAGANTAWLERTHVGATGPDWLFASSLGGEAIARTLIAGRAGWFYLAKELLPYPLMFEYPRWHIDVLTASQYCFPIVLLTVGVTLILLRNRIGRSPATAFFFFLGTLVPALGFTNIYPMRFSFVADHFQYLASIGPIALGAAAIHLLLRRSKALIFLPVVVIGVFGALTFARATVFQSEMSLYTDSIAKNPDGWMTQGNLGALLINDRRMDEAQGHLLKAIKLHPDNPVAALRMGQIASDRHENGVAIAWDRAAVQMDPRMAEPHFAMGETLATAGDTDGALDEYAQAIKLQPDNEAFRLAAGVLYSNLHRYPEAVVQFDEAVRIDPRSEIARIDRVGALERAGNYDRAAGELRAMLSTAPSAKLYRDLGIVETLRKRPSYAITAYDDALQLDPNLPDTRGRRDALARSLGPAR